MPWQVEMHSLRPLGLGLKTNPQKAHYKGQETKTDTVLSAKRCSPYRVLFKSSVPATSYGLHYPSLPTEQQPRLASARPRSSSVSQSKPLHPHDQLSLNTQTYLHREVVGAETEMVSSTERRVLRP